MLSSIYSHLRSSARVSACLAAAALVAMPAAAAGSSWTAPNRALGNDGRIYEVHVGSYGELFPDGDAATPQLGLMVLDVRNSDGVERLVVPGTDTWRPERFPMVSYDPRSSSLIVFWATGGYTDDHWSLQLATFRDGEWTQPSPVTADGVPVLIRGLPRVAVTSDDFFLDLGPDSAPFESRRTTFHIVWQDDNGIARYAPMSFMDGVHTGWSETLTLRAGNLKAQNGTDGDPVPTTMSSSLAGALHLERAREADAVALTLTDSADGSLVTLRIEEVPMSLAYLAQRVRAFIEEALSSGTPINVGALAEEIRADIIGVGAKCRLNPAVNQFLASEMAAWVVAHRDDLARGGGPLGTEGLGIEAWQRTLETGSSVFHKTNIRPDLKDDAVDLTTLAVPDTHLDELNQLIRIRARGYFQAPGGMGDGAASVFASDDGRALLVAWVDESSNTVSYVEDHGAGWTAAETLRLGADLSLAGALELLQRKIR